MSKLFLNRGCDQPQASGASRVIYSTKLQVDNRGPALRAEHPTAKKFRKRTVTDKQLRRMANVSRKNAAVCEHNVTSVAVAKMRRTKSYREFMQSSLPSESE